MAAVASASGAIPGTGTGSAPGATEALSAGSLATKLEGTPSLPDAAGKANPGPSVQIQVASDGGAQTALVASTRPVPVAEAAPTEAAPPPAPVAPAPVAAPPVAQVDSSMRWMLKNGAQEAQLQLHPDALGQVTIHLRVEGGEVHARLWVSEPASMQAVQNGRSHLELSLKEQGLQLGSFDLQQGNRPFQDASAPQGSSFQEPASALAARQETPAVSMPSLSNPHQIEFYA